MFKLSKKTLIIVAVVLFIVISFYVAAPWLHGKINIHLGKSAISSSMFPYEIGLTEVVIIQCYTTGSPPICEGGTLCYTKDAAECSLYEDVSGTQAGGKGNMALFLVAGAGQAGLSDGGQLIAAGMEMTMMDSGPLASTGGCYNCTARLNKLDKLLAWVDKYIIAGIRH
jgi:hypothetical protein